MGWTKGASSFVKSRLFEPDELSYSNTIDKDNNGVVIQKDRIGRLISKTTFTSGAILERSYIYEEYERLCGEISPALSQILSLSGATEITQAQQEMYMTTFRYDEKNRQISKTLPGNLRIDVVYDRYGRIVLKQDNRLREMDYWSFSKYDQYGRTITLRTSQLLLVILNYFMYGWIIIE